MATDLQDILLRILYQRKCFSLCQFHKNCVPAGMKKIIYVGQDAEK